LESPPLDAGGANANHRAVDSSTVAMMQDTWPNLAEPPAFAGENPAKVGSPHSYTTRLSSRHLGNLNIAFFDGHVSTFVVSTLMDGSGKNIPTSPVIWSPWNPDAP
jgi:prepilin-type processing-associated H-X9-DG protein